MMFKEQLGLVDIVTQMQTHLPLVELAMSHRIPAIVQKPFGQNLADVPRDDRRRRLQANTFLAVHENFRFQPPLLKVQELIDSGAIGEPDLGADQLPHRLGHLHRPALPPRRGALRPPRPRRPRARRRPLLPRRGRPPLGRTAAPQPDVRGEDTATMLCRHKAGAVSVVECTYEFRRMPDPFPETLVEIEGEPGAIVLRPNYVIELTANGERTILDVDARCCPGPSGPGTSCRTASSTPAGTWSRPFAPAVLPPQRR